MAQYSGVVATAYEVLGDDDFVAGIDEDARARTAALPCRARFGVADIPDHVIVDLVLAEVHLDVDGGADGDDVREYIAGDAVVDVAAIEPDAHWHGGYGG